MFALAELVVETPQPGPVHIHNEGVESTSANLTVVIIKSNFRTSNIYDHMTTVYRKR